MKYVRCRDVGVNCDFEARGAITEDVLTQCAHHARADHGMEEIPPELAARVLAAIRDEPSTASA
jgi:predicted small metal-binding protein